MRILLTNDDGIYAPGIFALYKALIEIADVSVVAPDSEQSAVGHAITMTDPLRVAQASRDNKFFGYAVSGTPADCIKIAIKAILKDKPDLILSGINLGSNLGVNVIYSGTISAATEGTILGIPSIAISLTSFTKPYFDYAAKFAATLAQKVYKNGLPKGILLNVNVPPLSEDEIQGVVVTKQGQSRFDEFFEKREDPRNRTYYWLSGKEILPEDSDATDHIAIAQNKISITPIQYDMTGYAAMETVKQCLCLGALVS